MSVPYKTKFCETCQDTTEHFDDRQYAEDNEKWNCIQCMDRQGSDDALDNATYFSDLDEDEEKAISVLSERGIVRVFNGEKSRI